MRAGAGLYQIPADDMVYILHAGGDRGLSSWRSQPGGSAGPGCPIHSDGALPIHAQVGLENRLDY